MSLTYGNHRPLIRITEDYLTGLFFFYFSVKPFFNREPADTTVLAGESVQFQCRVGGDPVPNILWRREDGTEPIGRGRILDDKSLRIEHVLPEDEGLYICNAENVAGSVSAKAFLTVHCKYPHDKFVKISLN